MEGVSDTVSVWLRELHVGTVECVAGLLAVREPPLITGLIMDNERVQLLAR